MIRLEHEGVSGRLKPVRARWEKGKIHAVIGPNGSGKTTLLELIAGVYAPWGHGALIYDDAPQNIAAPGTLAGWRSFVEADHLDPFPYPVIDVITWGLWHKNFGHVSSEDQKIALGAARDTGITHLAARSITSLSGGERKRAHLARSFASGTPISVWDEPFAPLDIAATLQICEAIRSRTNLGETFLISIHDIPLAAYIADTLTILKDGKILYQGAPDTLMSREAIESAFAIRLTSLGTKFPFERQTPTT
jgi:iron complex transport system ATP-binding protein